MAASTITRVTWTDGAAGTVINNARKNSDIYDKIDEMFAGAGAYATFALGGLLRVEGGQIAFPATQNPSASANVLDDYEEAAWTPTITGTGGATGQVYSVQNGIYTKIGRLVVAQFSLTLSPLGTITGNVQIGALPFTNGGSIYNCPIFWDALTTSYVFMSAQVSASAGAATIFGSTAAATNHLSTGILQANLAATSTFRGVLTYSV